MQCVEGLGTAAHLGLESFCLNPALLLGLCVGLQTTIEWAQSQPLRNISESSITVCLHSASTGSVCPQMRFRTQFRFKQGRTNGSANKNRHIRTKCEIARAPIYAHTQTRTHTRKRSNRTTHKRTHAHKQTYRQKHANAHIHTNRQTYT
jgi:hypothetical protein